MENLHSSEKMQICSIIGQRWPDAKVHYGHRSTRDFQQKEKFEFDTFKTVKFKEQSRKRKGRSTIVWHKIQADLCLVYNRPSQG